jgi:alcohol dehydrogenase class IV
MFSYCLPVNLLFGRGRLAEVGKTAAGFGQKALLVTGRRAAKASGLAGRIICLLNEAGVGCELFAEVEPNPLIGTAERGAQRIKSAGCDVVIGVGGGSAMDAAKAMAFMAVNDGDISDYIFGRRVGTKALPIVLIPTTAGTGSEGNGFAVLTHETTRDKKGLKVSAIVPSASIIDSELMETMPKSVVASTGFDALAHCIEAYIARRANPLSDLVALEGVRLIARSLPKLYSGNGIPEDWDHMALAATYGGMAIGTAGSGLPHALEHPVSGLKDVTHGEGLAAIVPEVLERTWPSAMGRFAELARALGAEGGSAEELAPEAAWAVRALLKELNLTRTLGELGVEPGDTEWLADNAIKIMQASAENNPLIFDREGLLSIYRACI